METTSSARCVYPLEQAKVLHLVRHAQGIHNIAGEKDHNALSSPEYFDAQLSPHGWEQVSNLNKQVQESGLLKKIDLVITSPLSRAMQTALAVFGSEDQSKEEEAEAEEESRKTSETSSVKCPPIIAVELCRERLGVHPCDRRRTITEYQGLFPEIDFSLIESDDDILWSADYRETFEEVAARGLKFIDWLWTRQEKEIAIVTHDRFLQNTLEALVNDSNPSVRSEMCKRFDNCELRSMVIVDKRQA